MPKVTQVEPQKKNPQRFNVFLDGKFAFGADEDLIVENRLIPGKEIDQAMLDKLLFESEVGKMSDRLYNLLSIRLRSEKEVRDYLRKKNFEKRIKEKEEISDVGIEFLIDRFKRKGLINDKVFAEAWVESRRRSKKKGIQVLKMELYQKGIDREIIEEIFSETLGGESEENLARQSLEKKLNSWKNLPELELRKKATEFLVRRGFEYSLAKTVIDNLIKKEYN